MSCSVLLGTTLYPPVDISFCDQDGVLGGECCTNLLLIELPAPWVQEVRGELCQRLQGRGQHRSTNCLAKSLPHQIPEWYTYCTATLAFHKLDFPAGEIPAVLSHFQRP